MPNVSLYQQLRTVDKNKYNKWNYDEKWIDQLKPGQKCLPKLKVDFQLYWSMQKGFGVYDINNKCEDNTLYFEGKYKDSDILRYIILGTITMLKYIYLQDWILEAHYDKVIDGVINEKITFTLDNDCNRGTQAFPDFYMEFDVVPKWEVFKRQIQDKYREVRRDKLLKITQGLNRNHRIKVEDSQFWKEYNELTRF